VDDIERRDHSLILANLYLDEVWSLVATEVSYAAHSGRRSLQALGRRSVCQRGHRRPEAVFGRCRLWSNLAPSEQPRAYGRFRQYETMHREPCLHCGTLIGSEQSVSLRTVMALTKLRPDEYVPSIVRLEGIAAELAQEFVDHRMGLGCVKSEPPCPSCGSPLKSWHATGCWSCGWRRDLSRQLADYYAGAQP